MALLGLARERHGGAVRGAAGGGRAVSAHRRARRGERIVIATHNAGKLREVAALLAPTASSWSAPGELGLPEPEETEESFLGNAAHQGAGRGARRRAAGAGRRFAASRSPRWPARPACARRTGRCSRTARATTPTAMRKVDGGRAGASRTAPPGSPARWCSPGRTGTSRASRAARGPLGLAAARRAWLRLRPDVRPRRRGADLRRDARRRKHRTATGRGPSRPWPPGVWARRGTLLSGPHARTATPRRP